MQTSRKPSTHHAQIQPVAAPVMISAARRQPDKCFAVRRPQRQGEAASRRREYFQALIAARARESERLFLSACWNAQF